MMGGGKFSMAWWQRSFSLRPTLAIPSHLLLGGGEGPGSRQLLPGTHFHSLNIFEAQRI